MAKEYIDREVAIKSIKNDLPNIVNYRKADAIECLETLPAADVAEIRHGRWLSAYEQALKLGITDKFMLEQAKNDKWWKFCHFCEQSSKGGSNYCPNCGAKMDGKKVLENSNE
jgi:hypothetical protein